MRWMDDPTKDGKSIADYYKYVSWMDVHYSSGLYNKAAYTLVTSHGWTMPELFKVFTAANKLYWTADSKFDEGVCALINAAADTFPSKAEEMEGHILAAFAVVGLGCSESAAAVVGGELTVGQCVEGLFGNQGQETSYSFALDSDTTTTVALSGGSGDVDLYVKRGSEATTSNWDCRPYAYGNNEKCTVNTAGTYHIMLNPYSDYSGVSLCVRAGDSALNVPESIMNFPKDLYAEPVVNDDGGEFLLMVIAGTICVLLGCIASLLCFALCIRPFIFVHGVKW